MLLKNFRLIRPPFEKPQKETLDWLCAAHIQADPSCEITIRERLSHVGCKPDRIAKRGHILKDFDHQNWDEMEIYRLNESVTGKSLTTRAAVFSREINSVFEQYYPETAVAPDDLIHVSCTGYVSPSGAQTIISKRGWGQKTTVTHAYHMGCYASIPAIRMARGFLLSDKSQVDIVHTEACSLHVNPSLHQTDQLVSQSLFADGFMKYSAVSECAEPHIKVKAIREEIIPDSLKAMSWNVHDWGFQMTLAKEIPVLITRQLVPFIERLCGRLPKTALFAVHPGGPKILIHTQTILGLSDYQMSHSFNVLHEYGNMSSATLPHIWDKILADPNIEEGTQIISLAFGPGLTIAGAWMEKVCGS